MPLIGRKPMFYQSIIHRKSMFYCFSPHYLYMISNGNRTEWSPIQSVIIQAITKSDGRAAGVRFVYHEYDYSNNNI